MNKHADLIEQYCQDWKETDKPWERWQVYNHNGWNDLVYPPLWHSDSLYRRKPKMITLGGIEFPEPLREAPEHGTSIFYSDHHVCCFSSYWKNYDWQLKLLQNRLLQATKEGAELQGQAILAALHQAINE